MDFSPFFSVAFTSVVLTPMIQLHFHWASTFAFLLSFLLTIPLVHCHWKYYGVLSFFPFFQFAFPFVFQISQVHYRRKCYNVLSVLHVFQPAFVLFMLFVLQVLMFQQVHHCKKYSNVPFSSPFSYSLFKRLWMALLVVIIDLLLALLEKMYNNSSNTTC